MAAPCVVVAVIPTEYKPKIRKKKQEPKKALMSESQMHHCGLPCSRNTGSAQI